MHAIVVDDSKTIRVILGRLLKELGFEVREAGHGMEALESLDQGPCPDLMLVDWNMPEMNGLELTQAIRSNPSYNDTLILMVTTETEMSQVVRALDAGANEYVMKPFTKEIILEKLTILGLDISERTMASPGDLG